MLQNHRHLRFTTHIAIIVKLISWSTLQLGRHLAAKMITTSSATCRQSKHVRTVDTLELVAHAVWL